MNSNDNNREGKEWVARAGGNRGGTRFFQRIIDAFGVYPAYGTLFFAAWQYVLFDRNASNAIRDYRTRMGLSTTPADLFRHFYSFGMTLIDRYAYSSARGVKFATTHINEELINREVEREKGVVLLGAHIGNWEFAGRLLTKRIAARVHVFIYAGEETVPEAVQGHQNLIVHHVQEAASDTAVEIINALRRREIVCLHGDRFFGQQRTEVLDFFGAPACFPVGPIAVASITGASVIPCFTIRTGLRRYTFSASEPVIIHSVQRNKRDEMIRTALKQYIGVLETVCRNYPYQWYNFYRFWKSE